MLAVDRVDDIPHDWITQSRRRIDAHLDRLLSPVQASPVTDAMRYSVLAPGKRVRPLLTLAVTDFLGAPETGAMHVACAIEMIHAASLIFDDLPCMDNDLERRRRLATHVEFGQDLAILAAVSLLTQSYCTVASHAGLASDLKLKLIELLCDAVGPSGLSLGQYIDLNSKSDTVSPAAITNIHHLKTGVLFLAAAKAGCLIGNASPSQEDKVMRFTRNIGLAFQLHDDLKDIDTAGMNLATRIGVANAERKFVDYLEAADGAIDGEENAASLRRIAGALFPDMVAYFQVDRVADAIGEADASR